MEQIIKFGISNYLQLCVEAGFSQIQSHICLALCMRMRMSAYTCVCMNVHAVCMSLCVYISLYVW